ncbi:MAG: ExeA family protein [Aeoliella sp.]
MPTLAEFANAEERVFPTHARVERYYPSAAAEEARRLLGRCLRRGEGPALLVGAPGTGKSMLLEVLADELGEERTVASLTSAQLCTRRALLQSILFELGQPYRQRDEGELRLALVDYLSGTEEGNRGILLLVDEAQSLPTRLLEELRVLGNLSHQGEPLVRLLLAGSQALDEKFTSPEVETFNQRIVARSYLAPFSHHDTAQYIRGHVAAAGGNPEELFSADALDAVYHATDGIARLVNQVCDRALLFAAGHGMLQVNKEVIHGAWADLQQLPTPWNLPEVPAVAHASEIEEPDDQDIVEFGPLSGEDSEFTSEFTTDDPRIATTNDIEDDLERIIADHQHESPACVYEPPAEQLPIDQHNEDAAISGNAVEDDKPIELAVDANLSEGEGKTAETEDPFGGAFDEEEVVIDEYAPLEAAMPANRPQVTNRCETEISSLLHGVMRCDDELRVEPEAVPLIEATSVETDFGEAYSGLSIVDMHDREEEEPLEPTELDEESSDEVLVACGTEEPDLLVVDDEVVVGAALSDVHRADYRQLFSNLLRN